MSTELTRFEHVQLLVVGDVMLDRYWSGATSRISPEAPVPVVRIEGAESRPGGAANVAVNAGAVGARARLLGLVGRDEAAQTLRGLLAGLGVEHQLIEADGVATVTKLRVVSRHQQLIRLDFEDRFVAAQTPLRELVSSALPSADALVLSDYGKGTLGEVAALIEAARRAGVPSLVDPKGTDFERYRGATLITPNLQEFEAVAGPCPSTARLAERASWMRQSLGLGAVLITRGEAGMTLVTAAGPQHFPARAREVFDVTGAGDTVLAILGVAVGAGIGLSRATALANLAAGIVVGRLGTAVVTREELAAADGEPGADPERGPDAAVVSAAQAEELAARARARGERVVMTNGCFDLLHPGHLDCLSRAKSLGDRLLVAVNDDASVARLKGAGRPVQPLVSRMRMLAGLASVDWVTSFAEDTPLALIRRIVPDVLVKGGDYAAGEIVGAQEVLAAGGRVEVLPYEPGESTSEIIARIAGRGPGP